MTTWGRTWSSVEAQAIGQRMTWLGGRRRLIEAVPTETAAEGLSIIVTLGRFRQLPDAEIELWLERSGMGGALTFSYWISCTTRTAFTRVIRVGNELFPPHYQWSGGDGVPLYDDCPAAIDLLRDKAERIAYYGVWLNGLVPREAVPLPDLLRRDWRFSSTP